MATFDDAQKASLIEITGLDAVTLDEHLTYVAEHITADLKTRVVGDINLWESYLDDFTQIKANDENFGADINPDRNRNAIRNRVRTSLFLRGSGASRTVRG